MKPISSVREFSGENKDKPIRELISDVPIQGKKYVLKYLKSAILSDVSDLKNIQGTLNNYNYLQRNKISSSIAKYYEMAEKALELESTDIEGCFKKWKVILGGDFPNYE